MTNTGVQEIIDARAQTLTVDGSGRKFDVVRLTTKNGSEANLFFEAERGEAVAFAIRNAIRGYIDV